MSHFTVCVFGEDPGTILAPYNKQDDKYCTEFQTELEADELEEKREKFASGKLVCGHMGNKPYNQIYDSFDEYMKEQYGCEPSDIVDAYGVKRNPNAKWDWWVIGGRWSNLLVRHDGKRCDQAKKSEINLPATVELQYQERKRYLESEEAKKFYLGNREEDLKNLRPEPPFFAFVSKEVGFVDKEDMGWFGMSRENENTHNYEKKFMKAWDAANDETLVTVVDCHI